MEIAKALSESVRILILDEPSAVIGPQEIQKLFTTLKKLKEDNVSIIYISHHLSEVFAIADRITVLKDGNSVSSSEVSQTDKDLIIRQMLGRSLETMFPIRKTVTGNDVFNIREINLGEKVKNISFSIKEGEILGIAGLVGSGRTETARAIFAADRPEKGKVILSGKNVIIRSPRDAVKLGIGMVPEDRKQHGVILSLGIKENISLSNIKKITGHFGFVKIGKERNITSELISKLSIRAGGENIPVSNLSGGNQQKVVLAKWLNRNCKVLIIDEPTRGIDIGAKVEIYNLINEISAKGTAIIFISSETAELTGICDRIIVMRKGEIQGELAKDQFSEEEILRLSIGAKSYLNNRKTGN